MTAEGRRTGGRTRDRIRAIELAGLMVKVSGEGAGNGEGTEEGGGDGGDHR